MSSEGDKISVTKKEVIEVHIGDREPLTLSADEASELHARLSDILGRRSVAGSQAQNAEEEPVQTFRSAPSPRAKRVIRSDAERRARQTLVMAGVVLIVIGGFFAAYDLTTASHAVSAFKAPPKPYVHYEIVAGSGGTLTFNGTSPGPSLTATVGDYVWITFTVATDSGQQHSWVLVPGNVSHNNPAPDFTPVFPNATTKNPTVGDAVGSTVQIVFKATAAGSYLYICEVPGHFLSGMYGYFNVSANSSSNATSAAALNCNCVSHASYTASMQQVATDSSNAKGNQASV